MFEGFLHWKNRSESYFREEGKVKRMRKTWIRTRTDSNARQNVKKLGTITDVTSEPNTWMEWNNHANFHLLFSVVLNAVFLYLYVLVINTMYVSISNILRYFFKWIRSIFSQYSILAEPNELYKQIHRNKHEVDRETKIVHPPTCLLATTRK